MLFKISCLLKLREKIRVVLTASLKLEFGPGKGVSEAGILPFCDSILT